MTVVSGHTPRRYERQRPNHPPLRLSRRRNRAATGSSGLRHSSATRMLCEAASRETPGGAHPPDRSLRPAQPPPARPDHRADRAGPRGPPASATGAAKLATARYRDPADPRGQVAVRACLRRMDHGPQAGVPPAEPQRQGRTLGDGLLLARPRRWWSRPTATRHVRRTVTSRRSCERLDITASGCLVPEPTTTTGSCAISDTAFARAAPPSGAPRDTPRRPVRNAVTRPLT